MPTAGTWVKMLVTGATLCIGGPYLVWYVTPTEEELFKKYNPELQKRSLQNRQQKQEEFDHFVNKLKEYSKSDKPIWEAAAEDEAKSSAARREKVLQEQRGLAEQSERLRQEIRSHSSR
ncbi:hypothetical protein W97_05524 [Coniosporium apollinis CBS 100218]|uniref:Cytochrome b mRNA-processing protein 4 n=1 Tax=Coniosporium apollinis (strain CBS 100218) TaxID=1168221 RepID=R7YWZ5_CONA1|nr:uncharacterized protein W97_05524 [Coniosporium apollinis CBS 100218]EON66427.1 hypothetical protein W97_05524 [Coniosporium apollinis CBS 100218]